ncbi:MAG: hypothetical protein KJN71_00755 [Acidimicrobiia bacterium]|nr:hypothetical protein [Acidimicrobiia bacterium]NNC76029.1 hypothetical protein [Acidimicrobiia bacterium]
MARNDSSIGRPLSHHFEGALETLAADLEGIPWGVAGSTMVALLGGDVKPADIDITCHSEAFEAFRSTLDDVIEMETGGPIWRNAWWMRGSVSGVSVDVMGGPAIDVNGRRVDLTAVSELEVAIGSNRVTLADPAEWVFVYRSIDPAKAAVLAEIVGPSDIAAAGARLGIDPPYTGLTAPE